MGKGKDDTFTVRDEANALTALVFRNGYLEDLHAGRHDAALDDPEVSRITDAEMKRLMIETSAALARLLDLRSKDPDGYAREIAFGARYARNWVRDWPLPPVQPPGKT